MTTSWKSIGLEMEGAHYQKAIQVASKIRKHISEDLFVMYAYYASDNPLKQVLPFSSWRISRINGCKTYLLNHT